MGDAVMSVRTRKVLATTMNPIAFRLAMHQHRRMANDNLVYYTYMASPVGRILISGTVDALRHISLPGDNQYRPRPDWIEDPGPLKDAIEQLSSYFDGGRTTFDLPLEPRGSSFQREVWAALQTIPYGQTRSYGDIARQLGKPGSSRAVGAANGANPLPIVIPCHRVIDADGRLGGFSGGLSTKVKLLALEGVHFEDPAAQLTLF